MLSDYIRCPRKKEVLKRKTAYQAEKSFQLEFIGHLKWTVTVGLDNLKGLFQPKQFYDSKKRQIFR